AKLRAALKPGGVLLVLDLFQSAGLGDFLQNVVSVPYHLALQQTKGRNHPSSPEAAAAWEAHGRDDPYPTVNEVRRTCAELLPGAQVTRHLLWRYSIVWMKGGR
ncbi:MAG: class I SAM-dependent methyltransferase, partial [Chloroflexota bacterium]